MINAEKKRTELKLVNHDVAQMLKKKGLWSDDIDARESMAFYRNGKLIISALPNDCIFDSDECYAPSVALVCKWLMDKHCISINIVNQFSVNEWMGLDCSITSWKFRPVRLDEPFMSNEEAQEAGILYVLENNLI